MQRFDKSCLRFTKKTLKCIGKNSWMSSPEVTFNLICGKGVTELQNLTNLHWSSFAESRQMQQKNVASPFNTAPHSPGPLPSVSSWHVPRALRLYLPGELIRLGKTFNNQDWPLKALNQGRIQGLGKGGSG